MPIIESDFESGYGKPHIRFWKRVNKNGPVHPTLGRCWLWMGACFDSGYGMFNVGVKTVRVHRYSWELHNGGILPGLVVMHQCDNPRCVNPSHLLLGTNAENTADMERKGRHPHSSYALTPEEVKYVRAAYRRYDKENGTPALAKKFGVSQVAIYYALGLRGKKHRSINGRRHNI